MKKVYRHISGVTGILLKEYKPTGRAFTIQIKLLDGRIFFAPKHEFEKL